jgi:hypothetical protein
MSKTIDIFIALGLVGMLSGNAYADLSDGLVADYPFNGNANDESGHGYNGTVIGAVPCEDRNGDANRAYCFDGADDYINIGQQPNFPSWDTYAVSVWFLNDGGGDQGRGYGQKIIDKTTWYTDFYLSVSGDGNGYLVWQTYENYSGGSIVEQSKNYTDGKWHHVVINKNGSSGELWIDGQLVGTSEIMKTVNNSQPLLFGYSVSGDFYQRKYWSGKLDDIRLYDRMLSEEEIQQLGYLAVTIDVKPGSDPNTINPLSKGVIPVAILSIGNFDATQVDASSVEFGPNGAKETHGQGHVEDVDGDGVPDMMLHFKTQETGIQCGDTEATLTGETFGGEKFMGTDSIQTVGCK